MMLTAPHKEAGPMQTLTIEVTQDHIDRLSKAKKPIFGLAELIWNSGLAKESSRRRLGKG